MAPLYFMKEGLYMNRGSTPEVGFKVPLLKESVKSVRIMIENGPFKLTRNTEKCTIVDNYISTRLTQEETLKLNPLRGEVRAQIQVLTIDGNSLVSGIFTCDVGDLLAEGVLK